MIGGAMSKPSKDPTSNPPKVAVTALDLCDGGIVFAKIPVAADGATPSPKPTINREMSNGPIPKVAHHGAIKVPKDHKMTP